LHNGKQDCHHAEEHSYEYVRTVAVLYSIHCTVYVLYAKSKSVEYSSTFVRKLDKFGLNDGCLIRGQLAAVKLAHEHLPKDEGAMGQEAGSHFWELVAPRAT